MLPSVVIDTTEHGCSHGCSHTNLQIPVDNPINMAVMDTLEDLLYAVAEGRGAMSKRRIVMKQIDGEKKRKGRTAEKRRRG